MSNVEHILKIVKKYTKPEELEKLKKYGVNDFYEDIGMKVNNRTKTLNPFFRSTENAFKPENITLEQFKEFITGVSELLYGTNYELDNLLKAKGDIKRMLLLYNNENSKFYKAWHDAKLYVTDEEFNKKREKATRAVKIKNLNVFKFPVSKVVEFYKTIFNKKNKDTIDCIIAVQASLGTRLIEILNSDVSHFEIKSNDIIQKGVAKMVRGKYKDKFNKIIVKKPIDLIKPSEIMKCINKIRETTDTQKSIGNVKLTEMYLPFVNRKLHNYLKDAGILNAELKSSHGLRRLYVAYSYFKRDNERETFSHFIKRNLGHETDGAIMNYNSIKVYDDSNEEEKKEEPPKILKPKTYVESQFARIESLIAQGFTTYKQMQENDVTTNMYLKYRKMKDAERRNNSSP